MSPGVPLITLIDLGDLWIHFDLREDLVKSLKVGDRFGVHIPALADRRVTVEVKLIATKGEYASWRATRATGDFDLRTYSSVPTRSTRCRNCGRHECLSRSANAQMKRRAKPGFLLVAAREWRWLLHDRVALFLIFGVPLFTFVVLTGGVQPAGDPRARRRRGRCRPFGHVTWPRRAGRRLAQSAHCRARRRSRVGR